MKPVLPVEKLCECGHILMSFGALFPPPTPWPCIASIQYRRLSVLNILPGAAQETSALFSHGPPIAPFLCSTVSEQGSTTWQLLHLWWAMVVDCSCHAHWFPRLDSPESAHSQVLLRVLIKPVPEVHHGTYITSFTLFSTVHKTFEDCDSLLNRVHLFKSRLMLDFAPKAHEAAQFLFFEF